MFQWNRTETKYPRHQTIADLFREQASRTPDAIAVVAADQTLTYRELDGRSNQLAQHLQSLGVRPEALVGIAMERSGDLVVSLLAILKAGGAYVPLDPKYPKARLSMIMEDSGLSVILTSRRVGSQLPVTENRLVALETVASSLTSHSAGPVERSAGPSNLAYVIYTSGSTGKPKGVMIEHHNVVNFFTGMDQVIGVEPGTWLAVTSISFDISVLELLWTLTRGFHLVIHEDESPHTIAQALSQYGITHLQMTPSLARMLAMDSRALLSLGSLKRLILGGEALPLSLVNQLREVYHGQIFNMYGPTETTIWSTACPIEKAPASISIGRPIANTVVYLLDQNLKPVALGEVGEIVIGGDGVVRGYWNRPELTAKRFLPDPFAAGKRMYRTGDLGRYLPDGNLEFLGRTDFQIKLRGFRIEAGEIEAALEQHPEVKQAVVVARQDKPGDKRLVAFLTTDGDQAVPVDALRRALAAQLPEYMIPSSFIFLKAMPLTDNLKIDRNALLELRMPTQASDGPQPTLEGDVERLVAEVWQDALGLEHVGREDNFFDLGAHSLTVAEVHGKLKELLERDFPLLDLFQFPSVRSLAAHLRGARLSPVSDRAQRRLAARSGR